MALTTEEIKQFLLREGTELAGVAAVNTFPPSVPPRPPERLLPSAKSAIVYGLPMLLGTISSNVRVALAHTKAVYTELDHISYQVGRLLEREGYLAVTVPSFLPTEMSQETKGLVGDLSLKHAAVAAGLGVWGRNRLVINPKWGPRVRYAAVLTDAALSPDSPLEEDLCNDCDLCIAVCPAGAVSPDGTFVATKCLLRLQPNYLSGLVRFLRSFVTKSVEEQQQALMEPKFWELYQAVAFGNSYECSRCLEICPVGQ